MDSKNFFVKLGHSCLNFYRVEGDASAFITLNNGCLGKSCAVTESLITITSKRMP